MRYVCGIVMFALCFTGPASAQEPTHRELLAAFEKQLKATAATAGPSIACVVVSRSDRYPKPKAPADTPGTLGTFDAKEFLKDNPSLERATLAKYLDLSDPRSIPDHGYAGGVVIDSSGLVLTPYHVIDKATKVYVFLPGGVGSYADIRAADARSDLAVLKLINPPPKLTAIKFADVRLRDLGDQKATVFAGKLVVLMANPYSSNFRLDQPSAAFGSITAIRDPISPPANSSFEMGTIKNYYKFGPLLEHDIKPNGGVTGGALVNLSGELVGLTTATVAVYDRQIGPGYAIPADDHFRRITDVLRKGEEVEYGFLGVSAPTEQPIGIRIGSVMPGQPAALAQIRSDDIITRIGGHPARTYEDLLLHVGCALAGAKVKVSIRRGREDREVEVTLAKYKHELPFIASVRPEPVFGLRVEYGSLLAQKNTGPRESPVVVPAGVWVREVIPDSPAATRFKTLGDDPTRWLITRVNGATVSAPSEFYNAAKGQDKVKLTLIDPSDPTREKELTLP
jgi:serine protease Do